MAGAFARPAVCAVGCASVMDFLAMIALAPAALQAAVEPAVRTASGASINTGIWSLFGVVVTAIAAVTVAFLKQWGPWKNSDSAAREADFARLRVEIAEQKERTDKLEKRVDLANAAASAAEQHAMRSDAKLQTALTACEVLLGLVEREMPEAKEIALVKRLLAQAASDDLGIGAGMRKIAAMRAV